MKKLFGVAVVSSILCMGLSVSAQVVLADFEAGADNAALPGIGAWSPHFSGTSTGNMVAASQVARVSTEQFVGGTRSAELGWQWLATSTNPPKRIRIQPAAGWNAANNGLVDRTSTPFVGFYLYGASQGDLVALFMGEAAQGGSTYEAFASHPIDWNGWRLIQHHVVNDTVTGFLTGNGTLNASHSMSGMVFYPPTATPATAATVTYYVDDFAFASASRGPSAGVDNWSVY